MCACVGVRGWACLCAGAGACVLQSVYCVVISKTVHSYSVLICHIFVSKLAMWCVFQGEESRGHGRWSRVRRFLVGGKPAVHVDNSSTFPEDI